MEHEITSSRRRFIKLGGTALSAIPLLVLANRATASTNASARSQFKYQGQPMGGKSCSGCVQFVSGTSPAALGACKIFPGDTEVSPSGYCIAWAAK
jgi:hypothetical protein